MNDHLVAVRVRGDFALFVRPEAKIERISYPLSTPSAARGVLEAIYWHPQFTWRIHEIQVLKESRNFSILRNEVNSKMSLAAGPFRADRDRSQRFSLCLRDVDYIFVAEPLVKPGTEPAAKHRDIFRRRVERGQCYHRPTLGTREFDAEFSPADGAPDPIDWTESLGLMLWDLDFSRGRQPYFPLFFDAKVEKGVMRVPSHPIGRNA